MKLNTKKIRELEEIANDLIERNDPCGALLIRWAIRLINKKQCTNCLNAYSRGYATGLKKVGESA